MSSKGIALFLCVAVTACDEAPEGTSFPVIRTENGVTVVENSTLEADSTSWRFDSIPQVVVGVAEGAPEYMIGRLAGYHRLPDGSILVGDGIAQSIRRYDASGRFTVKYGGDGDGPGEYRVLRTIAAYRADSILVVDYEGRRATILDASLNFIRSQRIRLQDGRAESVHTSDGVADISGDGHLLMYDYLNVCGLARSRGFCEDSMALFRTDVTGKPVAQLGRFVYMRSESRHVRPGRSVSWREPHPQVFRLTKGEKTYYADARRFEILIYGADGKLSTIVRAPYVRHNYGRRDLWPSQSPQPGGDTALAAELAILEEAQGSAAIPDSLPQISDLLVDVLGNIWVAEYIPAGKMSSAWPRWYVFSPEGVLTHTVRTPPEFKRLAAPWLRSNPQIGEDYGMSERRDEDGVESVVVYSLRKR